MNKKIEAVRRSVLNKVTPGKKENLEELRLAERMKKRIERIGKRRVEVILAGSIARNTHLKGDKDIDLFILFDKKVPRKKFVREGLRIAKEAVKGSSWEIDFGEHPYLKTEIEGHEIEIVPSYKISRPEELLSSVDRSPFHNYYLNERLTEKLRKEVRILKKFLKGINCYGAELKVQGFSGYLSELLILKYKSFEGLLKNAMKWKKGGMIDLEQYYKKREYTKIRRKFSVPLIVIDPTDKRRNAAAAVSMEKFNSFKEKSKEFLKKPSIEFFFPPKTRILSEKEAKEKLKGRDVLLIEIPYRKVHQDVTFGQLKKLVKQLKAELEKNDFKVLKEKVWSDELKRMIILIELKEMRLKETKIHRGPPIEMEEHKKRFLEKHEKRIGERVIKGRIHVEIPRKHVHAKSVVKELFERVMKHEAKKFISKQIKKNSIALEKEEILSLYKEKELKELISEFLA